MKVLILEESYRDFVPQSYTRFLWNVSFGTMTPVERWSLFSRHLSVYSTRFSEKPFDVMPVGATPFSINEKPDLIVNSQYIPHDHGRISENTLGITENGEFCYLYAKALMPKQLDAVLNGEFQTLKSAFDVKILKNAIYVRNIPDLIAKNALIIESDSRYFIKHPDFRSPASGIYVHQKARVDDFVSLNSESGHIIIDEGAHIRPFSIIDGPAYIGRDTLIDSAKVRSESTVKHHCRIGGEIESVVIESFTNKHHEGFVGHSYLGSWVNIGAIATTSDLKNNYGEVRLQIEKNTVQTGLIKLGSIICDYTKVGIGMMLNTGTVIGPGSNLFNENLKLPKYIPPFSWGLQKRYGIERFIKDLEKVMRRRQQELSDTHKEFLFNLYQKLVSGR